jgi:uncharacterized coiled-coil DUF342 family protein
VSASVNLGSNARTSDYGPNSAWAEEVRQLAKDRDAVIQQAREIRRIYDGLKMKFEVLQREGSSEAIQKTRTRMAELKVNFTNLKHERDRVAAMIAQGDADSAPFTH